MRNAGVFTIETYETILAQVESNYSMLDQSKQGGHNSKSAQIPGDAVTASTHTPINAERSSQNLTFDLSYFEKRAYDRYKMTLGMQIILDGKKITCETRDVSLSGMQLRAKVPLALQEGDRVGIDVSFSTERTLEQPVLDYQVVRIRHLLNDTLLALHCVETVPKDGLDLIAELVSSSAENALRNQADPEDALLTAQAQLAERFYMRSTTVLPFFLFGDRGDDPPLRIIFSNPINQQALEAFQIAPGQYDFHSLVTSKRLNLLKRLAFRDSQAETLIAVYRSSENSTPQVIADLECKNHKHWRRLLMKYVGQKEFRVFKVVARSARRPGAMRLENAIAPLSGHEDHLVQQLLVEANALAIVGALIDVTEQIKDWRENAMSADQASCDELLECQVEPEYLPPPQLVPVRFIQENRSEPRFLGRMLIKIHLAERILEVNTLDISAHGLSVIIAEPAIDFEIGRIIKISFPKLESHSSRLARLQGLFREVPAEVVGWQPDKTRRLRLKISDVSQGQRFSEAFSGYLAKRQPDLRLESSHAMRAVTSRLYSSIFVESSSTLPLFIYRRSLEDWGFKLGLVSSPSPLSGFFEVADGVFDFDVLGMNGRLEQLMHRVFAQGSAEMTLFLYKEQLPQSASFVLHSLADFEMTDMHLRQTFVERASKQDFRCVKIVASIPSAPPQAEIDQAIDHLGEMSPGKSERLRGDFADLVAIGDLVEITGLVDEIWGADDQD